MTRRPDVYRTNFPTRATANPRSIGASIFCDINTDGGSTSPDEYPETILCSIDLDVLEDYQRVFASATVAGIFPHSATQSQALANLYINVFGSNQAIIPGVSVQEIPGHATMTGAIDLPVGSYTFQLHIANGSFESGAYIEWGQSSLQLIVAQVVSAQECWYESICS